MSEQVFAHGLKTKCGLKVANNVNRINIKILHKLMPWILGAQ